MDDSYAMVIRRGKPGSREGGQHLLTLLQADLARPHDELGPALRHCRVEVAVDVHPLHGAASLVADEQEPAGHARLPPRRLALAAAPAHHAPGEAIRPDELRELPLPRGEGLAPGGEP